MGDGVVWGSVEIPGSLNGRKMNYYSTSFTAKYIENFLSFLLYFRPVPSREL